jgi:hypothetical protein
MKWENPPHNLPIEGLSESPAERDRERQRERRFTKPLAEMHRGSGDFPMIEREDSHHACLAAASLKTVEPSRHLKRSHGRKNARGKKLLLILFLQNLQPRS